MKLSTNQWTLLMMLLMMPSFLFSYAWKTCNDHKTTWNNNSTTMHISTTSFPVNSWWDQELQSAMNRWNNVKGSSFQFYFNRDTDGSHAEKNNVNEIYLANASELSNTGALAVTYSRFQCEREYSDLFGPTKTKYYEADIAFNPHYTWTDDNGNTWTGYNNSGVGYNFESVALHEFGHVLGLNHEDRSLATMNSYYPNSGPVGHYNVMEAHGDDRNGARYLYPDSTVETDIVASRYYRTGSGTSSEISIPTSASKGSSISIQYTTGNLSTASKQYRVGFYLSTNNYISKSDILLSDTTLMSAPTGASGTHTKSLNIPTNISSGTYYIGFIVDDHSENSESDESNNFISLGSIYIY